MRLRSAIFAVLLSFPALAGAQQSNNDNEMQGMPGMNGGQMQGMQMGGDGLITMHPESFVQEIVRHGASGTSAEPNSTPVPMLMTAKGAWMLMFHANAFVIDEQQSSPRGGSKFFSTNWFMGMAQRPLGPGVFTARAMLSLEPATVTHAAIRYCSNKEKQPSESQLSTVSIHMISSWRLPRFTI